MPDRPYFLLTNDDGIEAPGLRALWESLSEIAETIIVAPASEMSAVGHAITLSDPLRVQKREHDGSLFGYAVNGTPADCVKIAYWALLDRTPDAVISGINLGINTGVNTIYSGTVSAATEGAFLGIPSFAVSLATFHDPDFSYAAKFSKQLAQILLKNGLPAGVTLNVNVPACPESEVQGVSITRQGQAMFREEFDKRIDPHGRVYYWLTGQKIDPETDIEVDDGAVKKKMVSVTPIHYDLTHYETLESLRDWKLEV